MAVRKIKPLPWLTVAATRFLEGYITGDSHVLEFGAGGSTVWFAKRVLWLTTIEHDPAWVKAVVDKCKEAEQRPITWQTRLGPRPYADQCQPMQDYWYDLVLVDGRDRVDCVAAAMRLVKPNGVLMLDNAERKGYDPAKQMLAEWDYCHSEQRQPHPDFPTTVLPWHTDWWFKPSDA